MENKFSITRPEGLTPADQGMILAIMNGHTSDRDLSETLGISLSGVNNRLRGREGDGGLRKRIEELTGEWPANRAQMAYIIVKRGIGEFK